MKYSIRVDGRDDYTKVEIDLTEEQYNLVSHIADLITEEASYGCMPDIVVTEVEE